MMKKWIFLFLLTPVSALAAVTYEQIDTLLYRVFYTDGIPDGDRQTWIVSLRADQNIITVSGEMEQNYLLRGDPSAYPESAADLLERTRRQLIQEVHAEVVRRVQAYEPGIKSLDELKLLADLWPGLDAPSLSGDIVTTKNLGVEARAAVNWLKDPVRTQIELDAYDPAVDPGWSG